MAATCRRSASCCIAAAHGLEAIDDEYDHSAWLGYVQPNVLWL